ncbi:hypothetical protein [Vibrio fluvialis]|uniref:hypothetical protein n=1 Tax=Vibrio fluvialis TaxID=676 RepID=UPI001C9C3D31|nr:hypothetical protein [Vibrio fluvialis]ELK3679251.1 hypothetical protein [Vibrio fluvialis]MBY7767206.1 hypothetical protein [Vibrio fluvialis]MBY7775828.1 hypothetical protein [Vibrio fluvialis]MBY7780168.1 hypothetical protein [Vibrio fluvialis]MBY7989438.1 hypothetical protein [Vibrio fluvialis]
MISDQNLEQLAKDIHNSEVIFRWDYTGFGGYRAAKARWFMVITAGCIPLALLLFSELDIASVYFWINVMVCIGMVFAGRYLFLSDRTFCYSLTPVGIFYTEQVAVPDSAYTFVRGFAWVGIAVCIVALFLIGPIAFVGVAGCALLSFGLTNFNPEIAKKEVYFSNELIIFDPENDILLEINTNDEFHPKLVRSIFFNTFDEKRVFIEKLRVIHENFEYNKLKSINEQYKHPIFNREPKSE